MSIKLRELIRNVRACKTQADERLVISKECALLRTAFKEEQVEFRNRNVAKLLFIHMMGYPAHFGQMECIKLISHAHGFMDKRIGYLGLVLLLTDKEEVLMLATNGLKVDLNHQSPFVVGLALTSVGNLATADMCRDLMMDVDKHLRSSNPYVRKKAALAAIRILRKLPEHVEDFTDRMTSIMKVGDSRNHGVLLCGVQLMTSVIEQDPKGLAPVFQPAVPTLLRMLKNLASVGYAPEYDVNGVTDPFLQVKILRLLRLLGQESAESAEQMSDMLTQVASNTDTAKNAGNSILYECVNTMMSIEVDGDLRSLGINILGKFLQNRDNNIRYIALKTLHKVVHGDPAAVQRHTAVVVSCLKDPDVTIRQRALELIYELYDASNAVYLTRELLNYLAVAQLEHKPSLCDHIVTSVEKWGTDERWRVDSLITVLQIAGNSCSSSIAATCIFHIGQCTGYHGYITHKFYRLLREQLACVEKQLVVVGVWCIGEYGELLLKDLPALPGVEDGHEGAQACIALQPQDIIKLIGKLMVHHDATSTTRSYCLTALAKLSERFGADPSVAASINSLIKSYQGSLQLELQQRSCEYVELLSDKWGTVRAEALDKMPVMAQNVLRQQKHVNGDANLDDWDDDAPKKGNMKGPASPTPAARQAQPAANLLNLDDLFGTSATTGTTGTGASTEAGAPPAADLLSDLFGGSAPPAAPPAAPAPALDPFSAAIASSTPAPAPVTDFVAYENAALRISFHCTKPGPTVVLASFVSKAQQNLDDFCLQVALPKYLQMKLDGASSTTVLASGEPTTQTITVTRTHESGSQEKPLMMKLRVVYTLGGEKVTETAQVSNFPPGF